ncbi:MAG TPA: hypothetical protein VF173_10170 [Thermoanaerobaculia bacterium]|nr:hypothetical protein [Thermoanaerobaculia bacterium]
MTLLEQAQAVLYGLSQELVPLNCYWYGAVVVDGQDAVHLLEAKGPCKPPEPGQEMHPPYDLGWPDANGSPLVGKFGQGEEKRWIAFTDCSGFISWVVQHLNPNTYAAIQEQVGKIKGDFDSKLGGYLRTIDEQHHQNWPSAADFAVLGILGQATAPLQSLGGNDKLDLATLQSGDILAWGLDPGGTDTGHVVFLVGTPVFDGDSWSVDVIDSSTLLHDNDNRPGQSHTGVGQGTINLQWNQEKDRWFINFDVQSTDHYRPARHTSALRVAV